jgi:shikimate dehydrogenase
MEINSSTKLVGVIGHPISHSFSPFIHNAAFKKYGLNFIYLAFDIRPQMLKDAIKGFTAIGMVGFNVTVPHKESILRYLDEISGEASHIGAVNTVLNKDGALIGYNTDCEGFLLSLKEEGLTLNEKTVVILGAGGAAKAVAVACAKENAKELVVLNRNLKKAKQLVKSLKFYYDISCEGLPLEKDSIIKTMKRTDILINATSVGMKDADPLLIPEDALFDSEKVVIDLIYNPPETILLKKAKQKGLKTINGLGMLVYQAALSFSFWTGQDPPIKTMQDSIKSLLKIH